jgi:hypothetical protein
MILTVVTRPACGHRITACLATLALALAACGGASPIPPASPAAVSPTPPARRAPDTASPDTASSDTTSSATENESQTIDLVLRAVNDTVGSLAGCSTPGPCQGDYMVGYDPLVDAGTGNEVGTFAYECFLVDVASTLYHCPGATITLTGRGQIVFTEVIEHESGKPPAVAPISGGIGEFLGATGTVTATVAGGGGGFLVTLTK